MHVTPLDGVLGAGADQETVTGRFGARFVDDRGGGVITRFSLMEASHE